MKYCNCCDYFEIGIKEINRYITLAFARDNTNVYKAKPFKYCPWCGQKLLEGEKE